MVGWTLQTVPRSNTLQLSEKREHCAEVSERKGPKIASLIALVICSVLFTVRVILCESYKQDLKNSVKKIFDTKLLSCKAKVRP